MRLPEAISLGRQAAFHGSPAAGVLPLRQALADAVDTSSSRREAALLLGICFGASGQFGSALEAVAPLWSDASPQAGAAHCLAGSIFRQIGDFHGATEHDEAALESIGSVQCEALLGRAADAVGAGQPDVADRYLRAAHGMWQSEWWREGIRMAWVDAEVALLRGDPSAALPGLRRALAQARRHNAPRHVAKTELFLGVTLRTASATADAAAAEGESLRLLSEAATGAQQLGAVPLVWAIATVRRQWLLEAGAAVEARQAELAAARAAMTIAGDLPADLREVWLARPDVHVP